MRVLWKFIKNQLRRTMVDTTGLYGQQVAFLLVMAAVR